jgi:hypothetical protein
VQWLAQIVTCRGNEAGLRLRCLFRRILLHHQCARRIGNARLEFARIGLQARRHAIEPLCQSAEFTAAAGCERRHIPALPKFHHRSGQPADRTDHGIADRQRQCDRDRKTGKA